MRTLREIAVEIRADWRVINNAAAKDALECMDCMELITERFVADPTGYSVVSTFLTHSIGWRGGTARRIKKELRAMCGHPRP